MKYKQKSLSSLKKRIKITGKGKVSRHKGGKRHLASSKTRARKRSLLNAVVVHKTFDKKMERLLPGYLK
jgi:large subunit ribosomal protein L35